MARPTRDQTLRDAILDLATKSYPNPIPVDVTSGEAEALARLLPPKAKPVNFIAILPEVLHRLVLEGKLTREDNGMFHPIYTHNPFGLPGAPKVETPESLTAWAKTEVLRPLRGLVTGIAPDDPVHRYGRVQLLKALLADDQEPLERFIRDQTKRIQGYKKVSENLTFLKALLPEDFNSDEREQALDYIATWDDN